MATTKAVWMRTNLYIKDTISQGRVQICIEGQCTKFVKTPGTTRVPLWSATFIKKAFEGLKLHRFQYELTASTICC